MGRLARLRAKLEQENLEAFIITSPENRRYISGFTGTNGLCFVTLDNAYLLTDFRYIQQAKSQAVDFQVIDGGVDLYKDLGDLSQGMARIAFEEDVITYSEYLKLQEALPQVEWVKQSKLLKVIRYRKDQTELTKIRQAIKLADEAFTHILGYIRPGMSEEEVSLEIEYSMRRSGASGGSFDFIVASGWRSAMPHGVASSKIIQPGELVTLDFGAVYQGYCSDMTRTIVMGEPDQKQKDIYDLVLQAQLVGLAAIKPGLRGRDVDAVARTRIQEAGYGEFFGHGLGHAVGLAIHEEPRLSPREEQVLEPGMVVTVEPGIYLPDWGGIRIEDMVLVTESGSEVLTQSPKQFIIIE